MHPLRLLALLALATTLPALAVDRHVNSQSTLDAAVAAAQPGDRIIVANGSYSGLYFNLTCSGTSAAPITIRAATAGGVTLTGDSRARLTGSYLVFHGFRFVDVLPVTGSNVIQLNGADYCRVTQCYFLRCGEGKHSHIVQLTGGATNNRIDHNTWEDLKGQGLGIVHNTSSTDNRIDHNYFNRTARPNDGNGNEPIQLGQGGSDANIMRATVEFNLIENMHASDGADPELISIKTASNTVRYNTTRNNGSSREIVLRDAQNCTVEGNFLLGDGIRVYGSGHKIINNYIEGAERAINFPGADGTDYPAVSNILIAHNTVVNPTTTGISLRTATGSQISNLTVKNNLVVGGASGVLLYEQQSGVTGVTYATNLGYNSGSATVSSGATVALTSNPNLTHDGVVHRLPSGASPAKSAATATPEVTLDQDGQPRTAPADLGADEYTAALVALTPLLTSDVGPAYLGGPFDPDGTSGSKLTVPSANVTASAHDGNVPANTVDNNLTTRWSASGDGQWIQFNLGANYTVTHLRVATHQGDTRRTGFHVQTSANGTTWTDTGSTASRPLISSGTTTALETYDIPNTTARYVRLVGHANTVNLWNSLAEVEIHGTAASTTLTPIADTYAFGGATGTNYGTATLMAAKDGSGTSFDRIAFLKFDLSSVPFTPASATLVLTTDASTESGTLTINQCTTDSWTETGLTWNNKPATGTAIGTKTIAAGTSVDLTQSVTSYVTSQLTSDSTKIISFALTGTNAQLWLKTRESGAANAPALILTP